MSRSLFSACFGLCLALAACGEKFVAGSASGGTGGTASAEGGAANAAGEAGMGGSAGNASADAGEAGSETGSVAGSPASGGTGGLLGNAGAGVGGALLEPALPQSGLLLWLRADRGVQQKDGLVQGWQDQSGNQTNATQTSTNARPTYLATGFNGRPTLQFDGQGQFLKFSDGFGNFSKGLAGLIVAKPTKSDCASMLEFSNGSEVDDIALAMWENKWTYEVTEPLIHTGNVDLRAFSLYAVNHHVTGLADLRIDGSTLETLDMPLPASVVRVNDFVGHTLYGGGCEYFKGQISEIILYSRALTNTELGVIEQYLYAHWALTDQPAPTP